VVVGLNVVVDGPVDALNSRALVVPKLVVVDVVELAVGISVVVVAELDSRSFADVAVVIADVLVVVVVVVTVVADTVLTVAVGVAVVGPLFVPKLVVVDVVVIELGIPSVVVATPDSKLLADAAVVVLVVVVVVVVVALTFVGISRNVVVLISAI